MTQLAPTNLIYAQALEVIDQLRKDYAALKYKTPHDVIEIINKALVDFEKQAGKTLTKYEPISYSEVPDSDKMNRFWSTLQADINILQQQVDLLRASGIFTHNFIKTEIAKSQNENKRLLSKLKALELYSNVDNDTIVYFGDSFISDDFIDKSRVSTGDRVMILGSGKVTLGVSEIETVIDKTTTVKILPGSNGFVGNNQEISDPNQAPIDPTTGEKQYVFMAELYDSSDVAQIIDNEPNTWLEFERYYVDKNIRDSVFNFNFHYATGTLPSESYIKDANSFSTDANGLINWAEGFGGSKKGTLRLKLEIDLKSTKPMNAITFTPYGLENNKNNPIKIVKVLYSSDGADWTTANPENVWIANSIDRRLSTIDSEIVSIDNAVWVLKETTQIRYIRFEIEQPNHIQSRVGHLFYLDEDYENAVTSNGLTNISLATSPEEVLYDDDVYYDNPAYDLELVDNENRSGPSYGETGTDGGVISENAQTAIELLAYRRKGPNPPANQPTKYYGVENINDDQLIQKREYFEGLRWAIGIRDIELNSIVYQESSFLISNKLNVSGIVDRVAIEADVEIPDEFDSSQNWILFYISPDDGITWHQISRIQDDFLGIPEMIAYNDPTPIDLRDPGVAYYSTNNPVESLRIKIELKRPSDDQYLTPVLKSYKLKVKKRI